MFNRFYMQAAAIVFKLQSIILVFKIPTDVIVSMFYAIAVGYNELAKQQTDVKRRVMCRMMRKVIGQTMMGLGIIKEPLPFNGNPVILEIAIDGAVPSVEFRESDWELMRKALAEHDARKAAK